MSHNTEASNGKYMVGIVQICIPETLTKRFLSVLTERGYIQSGE